MYRYELFLRLPDLSPTDWQRLFDSLHRHLGSFGSWKFEVILSRHTLHYYLLSSRDLPVSLSTGNFLLRPVSNFSSQYTDVSHQISCKFRFHHLGTIIERLHTLHQDFICLTATCQACANQTFSHVSIYAQYQAKTICYHLLCYNLPELLCINFTNHPSLCYKKFPKYLKSEKTLRCSHFESDDALLSLETFPYLDHTSYLRINDYSFIQHSLILGGSGTGKSKFIALFADRIYQLSSTSYKVIIIDPHDALRHDLTAITSQQIFDFSDRVHSTNLFAANVEHLGSYVELMLTLFQSLLGESFNGRLERVLRHSISLLTIISDFSFVSLRRLLLEASFRNQILNEHRERIPSHIAHFFLADFSEIRTQAYDLAIAPLIAFIDEMQMVPVFSEAKIDQEIITSLQRNFLTIFSLSRVKLGEKVTRTIAGLLMQQIFLLAESQVIPEHLMVIIDEVAVIENPILSRFLSELRKYHISVILAGQYLHQLSPDLRDSIFTNVQNYYLFRVSKSDATLLAQNISIKLAHDDTLEHRENLLTGLRARECLVRLSSGDELLPTAKARTMDYPPNQNAQNSKEEYVN